jgi:MFS family permease
MTDRRATAGERGTPDGVWAPDRRALTAGLVSTITIMAVESLAVGTILPDVKRALGGLGLYGWVFSAFFLGSIVGVVIAGRTTDHRGPRTAYLLGLALFVAGLLAAGLAPTMLVLVLARVVQGMGSGAVPATAYAAIGRAYPEPLRPRMFAVLSTAWVVPALVGPGFASAVSNAFGWRWVFLGLVPFVVIAGTVALRGLRPLDVVGGTAGPSRLTEALRVAIGAACVVAGLTAADLVALPLVVVGLVIGVPGFLALVPRGTVRAAPGLPAATLVRGVLTFAFFGSDAFISLAITDVRDSTTVVAGVAYTASALSWTAGSWLQERRVQRVGARRLVVIGHAVLVAGIALASLVLLEEVPLGLIVVAWIVAGFGIGLAYAPISLTVLREAPPGEEGTATAGMQLTDLLGVSLGTGLGGAAVAIGHAVGWSPRGGIAVAWALAGAAGIAGMAIARRLPGPSAEVEELPRVVAEDGFLASG